MKTYLLAFFTFLSFQQAFSQDAKPLVVATASIFADMAKNIAGGQVEVTSIVPIGGDPHMHEPTPADAKLVTSAQLILKNGLTFEGWLNELIENSGTEAQVVLITEGIEPIQSETYQNSSDPHAWMDAKRGLFYLENIKNALVELDPNNKEIYEFNYGVYRQQVEDMDAYILNEVAKIPEKQRILITSHDAFRYFGQRYGIRVDAILGTSTDAEAQTSDIIRLNKIISENKVPALFVESTVNPKLLRQLASDNDIQIGGELYSDSIGDPASPAPSYLDMLKHNANTIVAALSRKVNSKSDEQAENKTSGNSNYWLIGILILLLGGGFFFVFNRLNN